MAKSGRYWYEIAVLSAARAQALDLPQRRVSEVIGEPLRCTLVLAAGG